MVVLYGTMAAKERAMAKASMSKRRQKGQSKDNVDIGDEQKFTLPSQDPLVASAALTLWAMAITTTIK
jgi:hypothetical protein